MYRNYYSVNDMPQKFEKKDTDKSVIKTKEENKYIVKEKTSPGGIFSKMENDDVILLAVIFILLIDDCDDKLLLIVLGILLLNGINDNK